MSVSFDRAAEVFDRTRRIPRSVIEKIVESLKEELEELRLVLDVAVGIGRFARPLKDAGFDVVGIDISRKMLQKDLSKLMRIQLVYAKVQSQRETRYFIKD